jgi:hypothetical protein
VSHKEQIGKWILNLFNKAFEYMCNQPKDKNNLYDLPGQDKFSHTLIHILDVFLDVIASFRNCEADKESVLKYVCTLCNYESFQKSQSYCCRTIFNLFKYFGGVEKAVEGGVVLDNMKLKYDKWNLNTAAKLAYDGLTMAEIDKDAMLMSRMFSLCSVVMKSSGEYVYGDLKLMESKMARLASENPHFNYSVYKLESTVVAVYERYDDKLSLMSRTKKSCLDLLHEKYEETSHILDGDSDKYIKVANAIAIDLPMYVRSGGHSDERGGK